MVIISWAEIIFPRYKIQSLSVLSDSCFLLRLYITEECKCHSNSIYKYTCRLIITLMKKLILCVSDKVLRKDLFLLSLFSFLSQFWKCIVLIINYVIYSIVTWFIDILVLVTIRKMIHAVRLGFGLYTLIHNEQNKKVN